MQIKTILNPARTLCAVPGSSKKRVLENIARCVSEDRPELEEDQLFDSLLNRERLGSTGLGHGIAIPHCRFGQTRDVVGCLMTLADAIDFDSVDGEPVDIIFALIVPEEASDEHLQVLAKLAESFSKPDFCKQLRAARDSDELYQLAISVD